MINVEFFNFSKKSNSTARPSNGTVVSVDLKRGTTFQSPTFILRYGLDDFLNFNYCKWNDHYYFINAVTSINASQVEVSCTEDVLATYKTEIGNYTCFIERSSNLNTHYPDALWLPLEEWNKDNTIVAQPIDTFVNGYSGNYIVRTTGNDGISIYYMTQSQLDSLLSFMWSDGSWSDLATDTWLKLFFDPFKYILSIDWTPVRSSKFLGITDTVKLGFWDSNVSALLIGGNNAPSVSWSYDLGIVNSRYGMTDFRYWSTTYSRYFAKLPLVGIFPVDVTKCQNEQLTADYYYDVTSGVCDIWMRSGSNDLNHFQSQLSVPIQIGFATSNPVNLINGVAGTVVSMSTGNATGAISSGLTAGQSATAPEPSIIGQVGNINGILNNLDAGQYTYWRESLRPNVTTDGYADGTTRQISTLSGFIKCRNASVAINGYSGDQETVNNFLNTGFYYE